MIEEIGVKLKLLFNVGNVGIICVPVIGIWVDDDDDDDDVVCIGCNINVAWFVLVFVFVLDNAGLTIVGDGFAIKLFVFANCGPWFKPREFDDVNCLMFDVWDEIDVDDEDDDDVPITFENDEIGINDVIFDNDDKNDMYILC